EHPALAKGRDVLIIEDTLFFGDQHYPLKFHKMKLTFHRASMKCYLNGLINKNYKVKYLEYSSLRKDRNYLFNYFKKNNYSSIHFCKVDDFILDKRLKRLGLKNSIKITEYFNPSFLNDENYLKEYFRDKKGYFQHYFYIEQRKKFNILIDNGKPVNGKWSLDSENRKAIPKNLVIPKLTITNSNLNIINEAKEYVNLNFADNPGENENFYLPISTSEAKKWLDDFLVNKFHHFGDYQDAIVKDETFLFHSLLSPLLNAGLLTPDYVLNRTLKFIDSYPVPLNSAEGFIRQIIGWREFIRAVYLIEGVNKRNSNFWNNQRKIPESFYTATTGIEPIDATIKKLLETGYNHHIERLMLLGNFLLLCEINPNDVYTWFMEMYIDAYDWVMVPNVYGMSQFADGGLMSTKPYISSSNYVKKMSNYKSGEWTKIWDALFWNFINKHQKYFANNNRTVFISRNLEKMSNEKLQNHIEIAEEFLKRL
ncbi:MAG: cryptochrome/photolyase family protein, partial [Ignavibacteriae bacterium]|nr:cryptochrome/photolyase family protein [Ignavibacteriota bacterium]